MLQQNKENREIRKLSKERMKERSSKRGTHPRDGGRT